MLTKVKEYRNAKATSDMWDRIYMEEPENYEVELKWDCAYKDYRKALDCLVDEIIRITAGKIDRKTARAMVINRLDDLENICRRYER